MHSHTGPDSRSWSSHAAGREHRHCRRTV